MKNFHCCATCESFKAEKSQSGMRYSCNRLGYDTRPNYQFHCWNPKENVKKLIEKQK